VGFEFCTIERGSDGILHNGKRKQRFVTFRGAEFCRNVLVFLFSLPGLERASPVHLVHFYIIFVYFFIPLKMTAIAPEPVTTSKRLRTGITSYEPVQMITSSSPSLDVLPLALLAVSEL
jgi:hypothetical protein